MADKTTTLKTKTGDNVYPKILGESRDNAISDSPQIKHTLTADHKINFRLDTNVNNLINNSLQKPSGLTKTELVGVGANGQENIEIGDNLTLANGKLSATGGSSGGDAFDIIISHDMRTYTGTITGTKPVVLNIILGTNSTTYFANFYRNNEANFSTVKLDDRNSPYLIQLVASNGKLEVGSANLQTEIYNHTITMIDSARNIALYFNIQNNSDDLITSDTLVSCLGDKKTLVNGNLHGYVPTYIDGMFGYIRVYYMNPGDENINTQPDEFRDLSSFTISDEIW